MFRKDVTTARPQLLHSVNTNMENVNNYNCGFICYFCFMCEKYYSPVVPTRSDRLLRVQMSINWCGFSPIWCPSCSSSSSSSFTGEILSNSLTHSLTLTLLRSHSFTLFYSLSLLHSLTLTLSHTLSHTHSWSRLCPDVVEMFHSGFRWRERELSFCSGSRIEPESSTYSKFKTGKLLLNMEKTLIDCSLIKSRYPMHTG